MMSRRVSGLAAGVRDRAESDDFVVCVLAEGSDCPVPQSDRDDEGCDHIRQFVDVGLKIAVVSSGARSFAALAMP